MTFDRRIVEKVDEAQMMVGSILGVESGEPLQYL